MKKRVKSNEIFKFIAVIQIVFLITPIFINPAKADIVDNVQDFVDPVTQGIHDSAIDVTKQVLKQLLKELMAVTTV